MSTPDSNADFVATTYISHSHKPAAASDAPTLSEHEKDMKEIETLRLKLVDLELQLQTYQSETNDRLNHLEHHTKHPISPEERTFRILEDV